MKRRLFNFLAAVSLLLCSLTVWCWRHSQAGRPRLYIVPANGGTQKLVTVGGGIKYEWQASNDFVMHMNLSRYIGFAGFHYGETNIVYRFLVIPYWVPTFAFALLPLCVLITFIRRRWRAGRHRCTSCGYDLRASPERCPECGAVPVGGKA